MPFAFINQSIRCWLCARVGRMESRCYAATSETIVSSTNRKHGKCSELSDHLIINRLNNYRVLFLGD